jgi:hypothetical protein
MISTVSFLSAAKEENVPDIIGLPLSLAVSEGFVVKRNHYWFQTLDCIVGEIMKM